jgi:hypothetical protein
MDPDPRQNRRKLLHVRDPGTLEEGCRTLGQDPGNILDQALARFALADEDLDGELLHAAGGDARGRDLAVVHLNHLAVQRPELRPPDGDVLDDPLELDRRDEDDGVADRVPALEEHGEAREDVEQQPLGGKAGHDQCE